MEQNTNQYLSNISEEKRELAVKIKNEISLGYNDISKYGNEVSKKLTDFSTEILKSVKVKDSPEVADLLLSLTGELNSIDCTTLVAKKKGIFSKLLKGNDVKTFLAQYETIQDFISNVTKKLSQAEFQLSKDIEICDEHILKNREYIELLDLYIEAGQLKLAEAKQELEEEKITIDKDDLLGIQELSSKESAITMFERKIHNLLIQRAVAIQNIPQLRLIKDGDAILVEKINSSIDTSIPLWKSQMAIATEILRQKNGVEIVKKVTDTNNELLKRNSILLKQSTVAVATELERDIIDLETLKQTNENLITTIQDIRKIREDGIEKRKLVAKELVDLQSKLNNSMLLEAKG